MAKSNRVELNHVTIKPNYWRNFSGIGGRYNEPGNRNFCAFISEDQAAYLEGKGINVKRLEPRDEYSEPEYFIRVKVKLDSNWPPKFYVSTRDRNGEINSTELTYKNSDNSINEAVINGIDDYDIEDAHIRFNIGPQGGLYLHELSMLVSEGDKSLFEWGE
jgi:hypothetical protein